MKKNTKGKIQDHYNNQHTIAVYISNKNKTSQSNVTWPNILIAVQNMTIYRHFPKNAPIIPNLVQFTFSVINVIAKISSNKNYTIIYLFQMQNSIR